MRKYLKYNIIGLAILAMAIVSCDTASVDPESIVEPDASYPTVTFTAVDATVVEGQTAVVATITLNKPITKSLTFTPVFTGGTADEHSYIIEPTTIPAYETTAEVIITGVLDNIPESTENVTGTWTITSLAEKYLVQPGTTFPTFDVAITSVNDPTLLTIAFAWDTDEDHDIVTFSAQEGAWGNGGATGANPEIDQSIWLSDAPGEYYVNLIEWGNGSMNYTFSIGHPDQTVQTITGSYDANDVSDYIVDSWVQWGNPDTYRLLKVVHNGNDFTVTKY